MGWLYQDEYKMYSENNFYARAVFLIIKRNFVQKAIFKRGCQLYWDTLHKLTE